MTATVTNPAAFDPPAPAQLPLGPEETGRFYSIPITDPGYMACPFVMDNPALRYRWPTAVAVNVPLIPGDAEGEMYAKVALPRQAAVDVRAPAAELADKLATAAKAARDRSPEARAEAEAYAPLIAAEAELARARDRLAAAKSAYDAALAGRKNPAPFRAEIVAAELEVEDTRRWAADLRADYLPAAAAARQVGEAAWRIAKERELQVLAGRRASIKAKAEAVARELAAELLAIEAVERALKAMPAL